MTTQMISKDQVHISIFKLEFTPWLKFFPSKKTFFTSTSSSKNFHFIRKFLHGNLVRYGNLAIPEVPAINKSSAHLHRDRNVAKGDCNDALLLTSRGSESHSAPFGGAAVRVLVRWLVIVTELFRGFWDSASNWIMTATFYNLPY